MTQITHEIEAPWALRQFVAEPMGPVPTMDTAADGVLWLHNWFMYDPRMRGAIRCVPTTGKPMLYVLDPRTGERTARLSTTPPPPDHEAPDERSITITLTGPLETEDGVCWLAESAIDADLSAHADSPRQALEKLGQKIELQCIARGWPRLTKDAT